jgi:transposase-like protein
MIDAKSMLGKFKNLIELRDHFSNEMVCIKHLEAMRWEKEGIYCPYCGCKKVYKFKDNKTYKCSKCRTNFNVKIGSIFEDSNISLQKWFIAVYFISAHKKGISSLQLSKDIGVTQKTAWFMLHRLRVATNTQAFNQPLKNIVEADETYVGGKEKNKHKCKRLEGSQGRSGKGKVVVLGLIERNGNIKIKSVEHADQNTIRNYVLENVKVGSHVMTDEFRAYNGLADFYFHSTIDHSQGEYVVSKTIHTNTLEGFWSLMKRSIIGIFHHISHKHIDLYLNEFTYRYNTRKQTDENRFNLVLGNCKGRLKYADLIKA